MPESGRLSGFGSAPDPIWVVVCGGMPRPRGAPTTSLTVRVPVDVAELVAVAAEEAGVKRNEWLLSAIERALLAERDGM